MEVQMRFLVLLFFFSSLASAQVAGFRCETNPRTTSFLLDASGDDFVLTTKHSNGVEYMPVHEGIIVPHDLAYLTDVSNVLKHMGAINQFHFPKAKCQSYGKGLINCSGGNTQTLDGLSMTALGVTTEKITSHIFSDSIETVRVMLDVQIDGFTPVQEVTMDYSPEDCHFN
jgi:hypothetical protein